MSTHKELEDYLLALSNTKLTFPFGEEVSVYKVNVAKQQAVVEGELKEDWKMFALIPHDKTPVNISLKCDPQLAQVLRDQYESIMPGYHLNKKHWNTMLVTGQIAQQDLQDLILHSYNLVTGNSSALPAMSS